mgnify:CR=1 FL=1
MSLTKSSDAFYRFTEEQIQEGSSPDAYYLKAEKSTAGFIQRKTIAREVEQILQGGSNRIIVKTKKIVLKEYFDKLIEQGIEIEVKLKP